jgi:hypothetical protein
MDDRIVDATAMQLVMNPWQFDVIVTTNLFGDILSDQLAGLVGGLGMAPGANIGPDAAIFEAVHGSAPDIAGKGIANPLALLLAVGLMLEHVDQPDSLTVSEPPLIRSCARMGFALPIWAVKHPPPISLKASSVGWDNWQLREPSSLERNWCHLEVPLTCYAELQDQENKMPKGSDLLVAALENEGVDRFSGFPARRTWMSWKACATRRSS